MQFKNEIESLKRKSRMRMDTRINFFGFARCTAFLIRTSGACRCFSCFGRTRSNATGICVTRRRRLRRHRFEVSKIEVSRVKPIFCMTSFDGNIASALNKTRIICYLPPSKNGLSQLGVLPDRMIRDCTVLDDVSLSKGKIQKIQTVRQMNELKMMRFRANKMDC